MERKVGMKKTKEVPLYMRNADNFVDHKPNNKFYRGMLLGIAISCLIVACGAGILLFGDLILDFWRP